MEERKLTTSDFIAGAKPGENRERDNPASEGRPLDVQGAGGGTAMVSDRPGPLFPDHEAQDLRKRWDDIQASFVDEPRKAVEEADQLVASAIQRLAKSFSDERTRLEDQWARGKDVNTEDLRLSLQRYRSFFTRLLSI